MTQDIFISYKSEYVDIVKAITHTLEAEGILCWYATRDLEQNFAGKSYSDAINDVINRVNIVIAIVNDELLKSDWCRSEIEMALDLGKIVIPYSINKISISNGLTMRMRGRHWIDAFPNPERKFSLLVNNIKSHLNTLPSDLKAYTGFHYVQEDDSDFDYEEGEMLYEAKEYNDAILALSVSAEKGNRKASLLISKIFFHLPRTYDVSNDVWDVMESQAKQKFSHAYFALHTKYFRDQENYLISYEYVKKATLDKKNHYAYLRLGIHYGWGVGVKPNHILAKMWYDKAVAAGSIEAYAYLGQEYQYGTDKIEKDTKRAFELYQKGAEERDVRAIRLLGECYQYEIGTEKKIDKAIECYNRMIELEEFTGYSEIGILYYLEGDVDKAKEFYKKAAKHNVGDAFGSLAAMYWNESNVLEAMKWANAGFQMKNSYATNLLAYFYKEGSSNSNYKFEADIKKAWELYFVSYSWTSRPDNAVNLANIYFENYKPENIDTDYILKILDTAARNLDKDAINLLIEIYSGNKEIEKNDKKLFEYTLLGAEASIEEFMLKVADLYEQGIGVVQNSFKSIDWLEKAGHLGNTTTISRLIEICKNNRDDLSVELTQWVIEAAKVGMTEYFQEAAEYLETTNPEQSFKYIEELSRRGNAMAIATLSHYYTQGIGTEPSAALALEYKNKALIGSSLDERINITKKCSTIKDTERISRIEQDGIANEDDKEFYYNNYYSPLLFNEEKERNASFINSLNQHFEEKLKGNSMIKALISALENTYCAYNDLCIENKLSVIELNNITRYDFEGIPPYEIIDRITEDACRIFLDLKTHGLCKDYTFNLSASDFLDVCEKEAIENVQLLTISLIEVQIEIEDFDLLMHEIFLRYKNKDFKKLTEKLNFLIDSKSKIPLIEVKELEDWNEDEELKNLASLFEE